MLMTCTSVISQVSQLTRLTAATLLVFFPARAEKMASQMRRNILLLSRDLEGFVSLCLARFIVWKQTHRNR
jgi:hypothetical protein